MAVICLLRMMPVSIGCVMQVIEYFEKSICRNGWTDRKAADFFCPVRISHRLITINGLSGMEII